jgi:feruloyl esterase
MAGNIVYAGGMAIGLTEAIKLGYATANTDEGHDSSTEKADGEFLLGHPEKQIDFGYRANHLMTVAAKDLIKAFYGVAPRYSMYIGCSLGSQEAMSEVKRYPDDYDGVMAGAAMNQIVQFNAAQMWPSVLIARDPSKAITRAKINAIHKAVLETCGTAFEKQQGFLEDPSTCHFDPKSLLCKNGEDNPDCLTGSQAELVRQIYQGPVNPKTGEVIFIGPPPGAEGQMGMVTGNTPHTSSLGVYRYGVMQDPDWDWKKMDFSKDVDKAVQTVGTYMNTDARLNPFFDHGGKLMLYIGWEDYHNPLDTINYYKEIVRNAGPAIAGSVRLFVVPGMGHCFGGDGCGTFDKIAAMDKWIESGKAPDQMLSTKVQAGNVLMSRPLCAYPEVAEYKGSGDITQADNFVCAAPKPTIMQ